MEKCINWSDWKEDPRDNCFETRSCLEFEKVDEDDSFLRKLFFAESDQISSNDTIKKVTFSTWIAPFVLTTTALIGASALLMGKIK
ncbi:hypothetical protein DRO61_06140 [Candidatus Bathyarchaeota archaeon]|nr:MAG: hypothetical protein DRO61_06140 [Candidatus Bathyarchaeota archaeon]